MEGPSSTSNAGQDNKRPRSQNNALISYVAFVNRTNVPVDLLWADYQGRLIRYCERLNPEGRFCVNTYVTHPWVAINSDSKDRVLVGKSFVFQPKPWQGEQRRTAVFIDRPMETLLEICIQRVRQLVRDLDDINELEIPKNLIDDLKNKENVEFIELQDMAR